MTKPVLERHGRAYSALLAEWSGIVGPALAALSLPEKLASGARDRRGGILTVRVAGAAATEFQHLAPQIIERINTAVGFGAVTRLKVVQGPLPGQPSRPTRVRAEPSAESRAAIRTATAEVADAGLRSALARLGEAIAAEAEGKAAASDRLRRAAKAL